MFWSIEGRNPQADIDIDGRTRRVDKLVPVSFSGTAYIHDEGMPDGTIMGRWEGTCRCVIQANKRARLLIVLLLSGLFILPPIATALPVEEHVEGCTISLASDETKSFFPAGLQIDRQDTIFP